MHSPPACGFLWSAVRAFHASCYWVCKPGFGIGRSAVGSWPHPASFGYGRAFPLALLFCHHLTKPVVCTFVYKCLYPDRTRVRFFPVPRCQLVPFRVLIFHESGSLYVQPRVRTSTTTCSYFCNHVFVPPATTCSYNSKHVFLQFCHTLVVLFMQCLRIFSEM